MEYLRRLGRVIPTLLLSFVLALVVWISSTAQTDPTVTQTYPQPFDIQVVGQDSGLVLVNITPRQASLEISAPRSVWQNINSDQGLITVVADVSGLGAGTHRVRIQPEINPGARPLNVLSVSPSTVNVTLEKLATRTLPIHLVTTGEPAIGFQAETPTLSARTVTISGPASEVEKVQEVRATLDINQSHENINRSVTLQALDSNDAEVTNVSLSPEKIDLLQPITQRYGFRTVSVKVVVQGQIASGYRLTNISVFPLAVTVFSANPATVNNLPGFVETQPVTLDGIKNDIDSRVPLNLPNGVSVVGDQNVLVQVGVAAIESNLTLSNLAIEGRGLSANLNAQFSPTTVDVILSGALPLLDSLSASEVQVVVDLSGKEQGTFQVTPSVELNTTELRVVSVIPGTIEVTIGPAPTPTPTARP